jgi:hypothetical protein
VTASNGQHEFEIPRGGVDARCVETDHGEGVRAIAKVLAVAARDLDLVANGNIAQESEMRVAMGGIDGDAARAGLGGLLDVAGPEGERLAARACQHDGARADPFHLDPRDRPGVRPGPWLGRLAGRNALLERALQQHLRKPCLGMDVGAVGEQDGADEGKGEGQDDAGHRVSRMFGIPGSMRRVAPE